MSNSKLEIDDSILKSKLRIVPDEQDDESGSGLLPLWGDEQKELKTLFPEFGANERAETIKPQQGACIKTKNTKDGQDSKFFINICTSEVIPTPEDISDQELIAILDSEAPSDFKVPMSIGQGHEEKDKSGGECMAHDVIINPKFFSKMMDNPLFHNFFIIATMEGLEEKYDVTLDKNGWTLLKNKKYHGTMPEQTVRTKIPLVQELSSVRQWTPDDVKAEEGSLITEVESNPHSKSQTKESSVSNNKSSLILTEETSVPLLAEISSKSLKSNDVSHIKTESSKEVPNHSMEYVQNTKEGKLTSFLEIGVSLPDTCTGNKINVKLSEGEILIETQKYHFQGYLPHLIDTKRAMGHFITSTKELLLSLPVIK